MLYEGIGNGYRIESAGIQRGEKIPIKLEDIFNIAKQPVELEIPDERGRIVPPENQVALQFDWN